MEINITFVIQMIAFFFYLFFTMNYIWPYVENIIEKRKKKISFFIKKLKIVKNKIKYIKKKISKIKKEKKNTAFEIISKAELKGSNILKKYKDKAFLEYKKIIFNSNIQINLEKEIMYKNFYKDISKIICFVLTKITQKTLDKKIDNKLINKIIRKIKLC